MKKLTALLLALAFAACLLTGCGGTPDTSAKDSQSDTVSEEAEAEPAIQLADQEIETVQINGMKFHKFEGERNFERFAESLEAVVPIAAADIQPGELFHIVTLTYEDGTKERFDFIRSEADDSVWYVETEDGTVYQNAEFITEYITVEEVTPTLEVTVPDPEAMRAKIRLVLELEGLGVTYSTTDLRAAFALEVQERIAEGNDEESAIASAREELTWKMARYQYAVERGYGLTEEELEFRMAEGREKFESASGFEELEAYFTEQGTTVEAYRSLMRESIRIDYVEQDFRGQLYEEFRQGNDRIGDRVCENNMEYWIYYLLDILYPTMEDYSEQILSLRLDEAEAFYREHFSQAEP